MSNTIQFYNHTRRLFAAGDVSLADLKLMLVQGHEFDPTDTDLTGLESDEVHGNGWAEGGQAIANAAIQTADTNEATLTGDAISVTANGGSIGPATGAAVVDADSGNPLFYVAFLDDEASPDPQTAGEGTAFNVQWPGNVIHRWGAPE